MHTGSLVFFTSGYPGYPGFLQAWSSGLPFAAPLVAILLCHELGHYVVARRYQLDVSPPYFVPVPMFPTFIGTMGAFIRLRTVLSDRRQLFDVGVAGPIAGFLVALPVLSAGLALSHPVAPQEGFRGLAVYFAGGPQIPLGDSLITLLLQRLVLGRAAVVARAPRSPAGARRATAAAHVAALGRVGGAGAVRDHVCAGSLQNLREGERGTREGAGTPPASLVPLPGLRSIA